MGRAPFVTLTLVCTAAGVVAQQASVPDTEIDLITRAARLPSMRDVARGKGDPQIRVYIHGGAGTPDRAAMLRRSRGVVSGGVWLWWIVDQESGLDTANWRLRAGSFGCAEAPWQWAAGRAVLVCRATLPVTPDWAAMWRRLDSLGVWRLSDQSARLHNRRPFVTNGAFVTLETYDGRTYRRIRHGDPDSLNGPGARRAEAIASALDPAFAAVRIETAQWTPPPVTFPISGTVHDTAGRPVGGARITVSGHDVTLRTGPDGSFEVPYAVPFYAWLGFGGSGYRFVRYSIFDLPRQTRGPHRAVRTEIVLQPVGPDTLIVADVQGYEPAVADQTAEPAPWARRIHHGGGPPVGAPHGDLPALHPCVRAGEWERMQRTARVLTERLRDTTELGEGWRQAIGDVPTLPPGDSATFVFDDDACQRVATVINRDLLRWKIEPPVLLLRAGGSQFAFPSDASIGESGIVVHLDPWDRILGVLTW